MTDAHERLRRLLLVVPYVAHRPGIEVAALAGALGISRGQLEQELELLTLVGRPPFQPDDFIDLRVEKDRVWVELDQRLSEPPRLTAAEASALFSAARLFSPSPDDPLAGALRKLEAILPEPVRHRTEALRRAVDAEGAPSELGGLVSTLGKAVAEKREAAFDYFTSGRGTKERRAVRPYELRSHRGNWYLFAFCLTRKEMRLFRVDRIRDLELLDSTFEREAVAAASAPRDNEVRVRFSQTSAPWVRERFGSLAREAPGGALEVNVSGASERWLVQWILSFGGEAEVLEPEWARRAVEKAAAAVPRD